MWLSNLCPITIPSPSHRHYKMRCAQARGHKANGRKQDSKLSGHYDYKEAKIKTCVRKSKRQGTTPRGRLGVLGEAAGADLVFRLCFSDFQILCNVVQLFL